MATQGTPSRFILKHSTVPGAVPEIETLSVGELAINVADGKIFYRDQNDFLKAISVEFEESVLQNFYNDPEILLIDDITLTNNTFDAAGDPVNNFIIQYKNGNIENFGNIRGATGTGLTLLRTVNYVNELPDQNSIPPIPAEFNFNGALYAVLLGDSIDDSPSEAYTSAHVWQFNADDNAWTDIGAITGAPGLVGATGLVGPDYAELGYACSSENDPLTTGIVLETNIPINMTVERVYASLNTAATGSAVEVDILIDGSTIFENQTLVFSNTASNTYDEIGTFLNNEILFEINKNQKLSINLDAVDIGTATGLKVYLIGNRKNN